MTRPPKIRLVIYPWDGFREDNQTYRRSKCSFCNKEVIDLIELKPDAAPSACPVCHKEYVNGKHYVDRKWRSP